MHTMMLIYQIMLCNILMFAVHGFDCPYTECYCAGPDIYCDDRSLTTIPQLVVRENTFFTMLVLDDNLITNIQASSFPANLTVISLQNNPLADIDILAFADSANTLQDLSFSGVHLSMFSIALLNLRALQNLNVYNSVIEYWNVEAMKNIGGTLQILFLQNVGLTTWPLWIQYFSQLKELTLMGGLIDSIPDNSLDQLTHTLTSLNLDNNILTQVPKALSNLSALKKLSLEHNKIVDVQFLPNNSQLALLSLSHNRLYDSDQLTTMLRFYGNSLADLGLSDNRLTSIPDLDFMMKIGSLNFTRNLISNANSGSFPSALNELDLGYNSLSSIPMSIWSLSSLTNIVLPSNSIKEIVDATIPPWTASIEFGYNFITELTDTSFPQGSSLVVLRLNNNPINTISTQAFKNLAHLAELNLQYTKLTRMPTALSALNPFVTLDVSGIHGLVCTCLEQSLQPWIVAQTSENIIGNCGELSVYDFFANLSPSCPKL